MAIPLNILIVEDSANDAEMLVHELETRGFEPKWSRVETERDYLVGLASNIDLIFSDYTLPQFSTQQALHLLRQSANPDIPFIIVSGTIGEERAVESLRSGATDYVLKDRLERLVPIVDRALRETRDRIQRRRAEQYLVESERRFREMLQNLQLIAVTLDKGGEVTFCNDHLLELTGWKREEVLGQNWFEKFIPETHLEVKQMFLNYLRERKQLPLHYENPIQTRSGEIRQIFWNNTMLRDAQGNIVGSASVGEDVTERRRAEDALRESESKFRQLAENIQEVFWITDIAKEEMIYISPAYQKIWGRTCESLYQSPETWMIAIHPDHRETVLNAIKTKQERGEYDEIYRIVRPDGSLRWIHDRAFPVRNASNEVYRLVGVAEDITRQRELEEQFRQAQKMECIGQLAGGVAHDFNNLLTVINCYSQMLLEMRSLPADALDMMKEVFTAGERAANLTRQLLTFSRKQAMRPDRLDLNEVISDLAKMLRRLIGENIELRLELEPELPPIIGDAGMMDQVVMNLAVNARDAMPKGGRLGIKTSMERVGEDRAQSNAKIAGDFVCLSVEDTGCGMSQKVVSHIFEPFFTTKESGKGTGLGLATVFGIVNQHGGWIDVETEVGQGTVFKIFLPLGSETAAPLSKAAHSLKNFSGTETILLVEDETMLRGMAVAILQKLGYLVLEAEDGPDALRVWEENQGKVDLLLTDMVMPGGMTGGELAEQLKGFNPKLKAIYTSGYSAEMRGQFLSLRDQTVFLQKPYHPQKLAETVRNCLAGE